MKTTKMLTIPRLRSGWRACRAILVVAVGLMVWSAPMASGAQYLTVNGQPVDSITLEVGQSCTVEVVSDDTRSYEDAVGFGSGKFAKPRVLGDFSHLHTTASAGPSASVRKITGLYFYGYGVTAAGKGITPGVHFVFEYVAQQLGATYVKLYDSTLISLIDSVHITVVGRMGTAITYQGSLNHAGSPADGLYDFEFKLYPAPNGGIQEGNTIDINDVDVIEGQFAIELDFGSDVFNGDARWLEIGVRPGDSTGSFTTLSPRQEVTPTPYAIYAKAAGGAKQLVQDFVIAAGESVTAGDVVSFVEGYVQSGFALGDNIIHGSEYVFNLKTWDISVAALSSTQFVVTYQDDSNSRYGTAIIGDVSGNTITYGPEHVFQSDETHYISVAALSSTQFVVAYNSYGFSSYGAAVIGDVSASGNIITFGAEHVFNPALTRYISVAALSSTKFVVAYQDNSNSDYGTAIIGDVTGNTITFGAEHVFNSAFTQAPSTVALSSTKFVVEYDDWSDSAKQTAVIGDVSGNTITFGAEYAFSSAQIHYTDAAALSSTKFVVVYADSGNYYGKAIIGDVTGGIINFGSEYMFNSAYTGGPSVAALSSTKFLVGYTDDGNSNYGTAIIADVSGNTITFNQEYVFHSAYTPGISVAALSPTKLLMGYTDGGNSYYGTAIIGDSSKGELMGIAKESKIDGETVPVIISGVSDVHSGLIPGAVYYSDGAGDLTPAPTDYRVGLAISSTEILLGR